MSVTDPRPPDSSVSDDLDVDAMLIELGLDAEGLDAALQQSEPDHPAVPPQLWSPADDFEARIREQVERRLRDRETAWLVADLFGLPWHTARAVIETGDDGPR